MGDIGSPHNMIPTFLHVLREKMGGGGGEQKENRKEKKKEGKKGKRRRVFGFGDAAFIICSDQGAFMV